MIELLENFIEYLWNSDNEPAMYYIMNSGLPSILTMAQNGDYQKAVSSLQNMKEFVDQLSHEFDRSANMDWWFLNFNLSLIAIINIMFLH